MFVIGERPPATSGTEEAIETLMGLTTGTLGHLTDFGFARGIVPLVRPAKAVGPAFTVRLPGLDGTALHHALTLVREGEILVIDTLGDDTRGMWGGVVAHAAARAGVRGVVVDGPVLDFDELMESGVPVWCRGGTTALTGRKLGLEGQVLVPIQVGGAVVSPGDIVFADSDAVFFIPSDQASDTARRVAEREAKEPGIKARLDAGEKLGDISGASALLAEAGKLT